jgi:hypothetical protein
VVCTEETELAVVAGGAGCAAFAALVRRCGAAEFVTEAWLLDCTAQQRPLPREGAYCVGRAEVAMGGREEEVEEEQQEEHGKQEEQQEEQQEQQQGEQQQQHEEEEQQQQQQQQKEHEQEQEEVAVGDTEAAEDLEVTEQQEPEPATRAQKRPRMQLRSSLPATDDGGGMSVFSFDE